MSLQILEREQNTITIKNRVCSNPKCKNPTSTLIKPMGPIGTLTECWYKDGKGGWWCRRCYRSINRVTTMNYRGIKKQVFTHYFGPKFHCDGTMTKKCKVNDIRVLEMDHVEGVGNDHRRQISGGNDRFCGMKFYAWLKAHGYPPIPVRPRCANCHKIIGYERIEAKYRV